ncbi:MAG TPA: polysaccharide deacetylase family protein [Candidatus Limnocylindria bacterium]|nr:polysaccharide deacetylase family protein [Candidatus Limnocylindria bacterium]
MRTPALRLLPLLAVVALLVSVQPVAAASARIVSSGSRSQPTVALTFDDGDSPANARTILSTLEASGVPATFFPYTDAMRADPAVWHAIADAGYPIGNHTISHLDLPKISNADLRYQIAGATVLIKQFSGHAPIDVMRPPYGDYDGRVAQAAAAAGYPTLMLWDVDPRDWSGIPAATITRRVLGSARDGSVILLHAGPNHTPEALPAIIAGLRARGFGFVTVPQLLGGAHAVGPGGEAAPLPPPHVPHPVSVSMPSHPVPTAPLGQPVILLRGLEPPSPTVRNWMRLP